MNNQLITYYIPTNPNITKGTIYTLYINNNNNLDLTSILQDQNLTLNNIVTPFKENKIIIEESDYNVLLQMITQMQELLTRISNNINLYREEENKNLTELNKLNTECQNIIKKFVTERKI